MNDSSSLMVQPTTCGLCGATLEHSTESSCPRCKTEWRVVDGLGRVAGSAKRFEGATVISPSLVTIGIFGLALIAMGASGVYSAEGVVDALGSLFMLAVGLVGAIGGGARLLAPGWVRRDGATLRARVPHGLVRTTEVRIPTADVTDVILEGAVGEDATLWLVHRDGYALRISDSMPVERAENLGAQLRGLIEEPQVGYRGTPQR